MVIRAAVHPARLLPLSFAATHCKYYLCCRRHSTSIRAGSSTQPAIDDYCLILGESLLVHCSHVIATSIHWAWRMPFWVFVSHLPFPTLCIMECESVRDTRPIIHTEHYVQRNQSSQMVSTKAWVIAEAKMRCSDRHARP